MKNLIRVFVLGASLIFSPQIVFSATINVPGEQPTIQAGIDVAVNGDTVLVAPGVYGENIDFLGKSILVLGDKGPDSTTLTYPEVCDNLIRFESGEDTLAILDGFTVRDVVHRLAVVQITSSAATIRNCRFINNYNNQGVSSWGVIGIHLGIFLICHDNYFEGNSSYSSACIGNSAGSGRIYNNTFIGNQAFGDYGGAVGIGGWMGNSTYLIEGNLFKNNSGPAGGGVFVSQNNNTIIRNNTFISNTSGDGGGVCVWYYCSGIVIEKNIFVNNSSAVANIHGSVVSVDYNDAYNNEYVGAISPGPCSFSADPQFCDTASSNYRLRPLSPCLPQNNVCGVLVGAYVVGCSDDTTPVTVIEEHFDGSTLSPIWTRVGGVDSDIEILNSRLTVRTINNGIPDGPWSHIYLMTRFDARKGFTLDVAYSYTNAEYNVFRIDLLDTAGVWQYSFRIWDTPSDWILVGKEPPCYREFPRNNNWIPSDLHIRRVTDTITFAWSDTIQLVCSSDLQIGYVRLGFASCCGYPFTPVSIDSIYAYAFYPAEIVSISIDSLPDIYHVINHLPKLFWQYYDMNSNPQDSVQIQVGSDEDWAYAEMWNPAPVASSDTFVTYAGAELVDGETYYLRLRVHNGTIWSAWYDTTFRMNSVPSIPVPLWPADEEVVKETFPTLYIQNSTDAEGDSLTYDFWIAKWNPVGPPPDPFVDSIGNYEGEDSTGWQVPAFYPLEDNQKYFWQARAFDQYEKSGWSDFMRSFWVNTVEEAPWPFELTYPPDTAGSILFDMMPQFYWGIVTEPDPFDNVTHTLYLAIDSNFQFMQTISGIPLNYYDAVDSLWFGTRYWWKVEARDANDNSMFSSNVLSFRTWKLGDASGDWNVNILDVTFLISALYKGGPQPSPEYVGDVNGNCMMNILDVTYLIGYLYKGGPEPKVGCGG